MSRSTGRITLVDLSSEVVNELVIGQYTYLYFKRVDSQSIVSDYFYLLIKFK